MAKSEYPDAPRLAVGAVVIYDNKVLLVLRGKAPSKNMWAIPGGSVNLGETLQAAAEREVFEETGLQVKAGEVVYYFEAIYHDEAERVQYHYVILDLEAQLVGLAEPLTPADDALDAGWFSLAQLEKTDFSISTTTRDLLQNLMRSP